MDVIGAEILTIAYRRVDLQISTVEYPGRRSLYEANLGNIDGEIQRVIGLEQDYPNLIRVATPVNYVEPHFFSNDKNITLDDCQALENYSIGIIRGIIYQEQCAEGANKVRVVDDFDVLMKLVDSGRLDVVIAAKVNGMSGIIRHNMESVHLLSPPPFEPIKLYHYLHKKNASLVPKIDQVLREMWVSGEHKEIRDRKFREFLASHNRE